MHLSAHVQRTIAVAVAALGAAVLGVAAGGMGGIDRELQAAAAAAPAVETQRVVEHRACGELYEWQRETLH
jgi:hypothetical protein